MKKTYKIVFFLMLNAANAQQISSTFDVDIDNWVVSGDASSAIPNYLATGGNPGGYASADDSTTGGVWFWSAPAKFLGDQSTSLGKTLSFDLKQSNLSSQFDSDDIFITSPAITIVLELPNNPGIEWTSYNVTFDTTFPWKIDNRGGVLATTEQISALLSNITSLKIRGEYVSGSDTGGLDNVILGANPLTLKEFSNISTICYPNPSKGILNFNSDMIFEHSNLQIIDVSGRIVFSEANLSTNKTIDISSLQSGIYVVKMNQDGKTFSQKIIKE